ncbi:Clr5 domain-containing protein [Xylariaceae sp. FL1272]|nr:Clr5 domain-containing protein [Xylariaceae sp. FL1272]
MEGSNEKTMVLLNPKQPAYREHYYSDLVGLDIPVQVLDRQTEHAKQYTEDEWDEMKPRIYQLYMKEERSLKSVMRILAEQNDFHPTIRMFKIRFRRWNWRKNRVQDRTREGAPPRKGTKGDPKGVNALQLEVQHLMSPEILVDQEVPIAISRNYTIDRSGSERWNCIVLNMSETKLTDEQQKTAARFCDAETAYVTTIHQLRGGRIKDAFQSLNRLFDTMTGHRLYLHPKYLTGFWLLCHGIYNACAWINDKDFNLLRELVCFHGANAAACFQKDKSTGAHPIVSLMKAVARMSRDSPQTMKQTFRTAYRAAADSLQEKLGPNHPVVLLTWTEYFWYFNHPVDRRMNLVARQEAALLENEEAIGREADVTICVLHNFVFYLFYCEGDDRLAREYLRDLLGRTRRRIKSQASPTVASFHVQRAHAFGSILQGIFYLQDDGDMERCRDLITATIEWLQGCEGSDAVMHSRMLMMDLYTLTMAWQGGKNLRDLTLAHAKPRSADYDDARPRNERQLSEETTSSGDSPQK